MRVSGCAGVGACICVCVCNNNHWIGLDWIECICICVPGAEMIDGIIASVKTSTSKELNNRCNVRLVLVFAEFRTLRGEEQTEIFVK